MSIWAAIVAGALLTALYFAVKLAADLIAAAFWLAVAVVGTVLSPIRKKRHRH